MSAPTEREQQLIDRVERLEHLLLILSGSHGSGDTFAGPIVANEAAASALAGLVDGEQVFVLSHRSIWTKRTGVPGTQGVPPLSPHEVIVSNTAAPDGVLCRTTYSDPALRVGINDIFIDPAAGIANDENNGLTAATPLKTGYELHRRWGWSDSKPLVGCNLATSPLGFVIIHVQSDLVSPDSLPIKITVAHDSSIQIQSPLLAANILRTATLTDAVTAMNRAAPLGGTRLTIRDNTLASWAPFKVFNRRVRFLDGPAGPGVGSEFGGTLQPQTDALIAPGQAQCSPCQGTAPSGFVLTPTTVTPAVGNTYVVEKLVVVNMGEVDIDEELNPTFGGFSVFVNFVNINLPDTGSQEWVPRTRGGYAGGVVINCYQCTFDRNIDNSLANIHCIACYGSKGIFGVGGSAQEYILGGGWNGEIVGSNVIVAINGNPSIESSMDFDVCFNSANIVAFTGPIKNVASWNAAPGALNVAGHGFMIGGGGPAPFFGFRGSAQCKGTLWGNTTTAGATGVLVCASCNGVGAPQNCTGPTADFKLANKVVGWWFNDATSVYDPVGAPVATTWAALTAAEGAAGFGGNAHELDSNTHFVAAETTA